MQFTNKYNLPQPFVKSVINDSYSAGKNTDISVTRLIDSPRKVALEKKYAEYIIEDVSDRLWALWGQCAHAILERAECDAVTEERLFIRRQNWNISGKFDRLLIDEGILQDYKITSVYGVKNGGRKFEEQLNLLAHILRENGNNVNKLEIVALLRDWSASQAKRSKDYPQCQVLVLRIKKWTPEECENYIDMKIRLHQLAEIELQDCSEEERWSQKDKYAIIKRGNKRARKVYNNIEEAENAIKDLGEEYKIEIRKSESLRCMSYCKVSKFCDQWKRLNESVETSV